MLVSYQT